MQMYNCWQSAAPGSEKVCQRCKRSQITQLIHLEPHLFVNTSPSTNTVKQNNGYVP